MNPRLHVPGHTRPRSAARDVPAVEELPTIEGEPIPSIYIVGAQSTGKTTLVNALRDHFAHPSSDSPSYPLHYHHQHAPPPQIIEERARIVFKQQRFTADDVMKSPERYMRIQRLILESQHRAEARALERSEWFVSDRSGADALFYASRHIGLVALGLLCRTRQWRELRERLRRSLIVVCEAGSDWLVDDGSGIRIMPSGGRDEWIDIDSEFRGLLDSLDLKYEVLPCGVTELGERVRWVLEKHDDYVREMTALS